MKPKTVGELRQELAAISDDTVVTVAHRNTRGYPQKGFQANPNPAPQNDTVRQHSGDAIEFMCVPDLNRFVLIY